MGVVRDYVLPAYASISIFSDNEAVADMSILASESSESSFLSASSSIFIKSLNAASSASLVSRSLYLPAVLARKMSAAISPPPVSIFLKRPSASTKMPALLSPGSDIAGVAVVEEDDEDDDDEKKPKSSTHKKGKSSHHKKNGGGRRLRSSN